jgi:DNA-binding IclR family transcriptional regulator
MICPPSEYSAPALGVGSQIVKAVEKYGSLPIDYLARTFGKSREEVEEYVSELQKAGLVKVKGDDVCLGARFEHQSFLKRIVRSISNGLVR